MWQYRRYYEKYLYILAGRREWKSAWKKYFWRNILGVTSKKIREVRGIFFYTDQCYPEQLQGHMVVL
jgi:hypothetical protein